MFKVEYMNPGSFLANQPRYFQTENEARQWCKDRGLRQITEHLQLGTFRLTVITE